MKTKEQMSVILSRRKVPGMLLNSTWADLVDSIQAYTPEQKDGFVTAVASKKTRQVGDMLYRALLKNAEMRAKLNIDQILSDSTLSLPELDTII